MKLKKLYEGAVSSARSDIVNMINDQATIIAHDIKKVLKKKPHLHKTDHSSTPAIVNVDTELGPIQIQVLGDTEFRMEISDKISELLDIANIYSYKSYDDIVDRVKEIHQAIEAWS